MYWLYLIIFVTMVFVPDIVKGSLFGVGQETAEELLIFLLGGAGFIFYLIKEGQLNADRQEKTKAQRDANRMSKDLTSSYSYIGEINRKLEIFKNISLGLPTWSKMTLAKEKEVFEYIMAAIKILTKADEYSIRFVKIPSCETLLEIKSKRSVKFDLPVVDCLDKSRKYFETDEYIVTISPEDIHGLISILTIKKKNSSHSFDDPDILKAIASQALFLYVFTERRHRKR